MEKVMLGLFDDPDEPCQECFGVDLHRSNLAVFGIGRSGKTTLLQTMLMHIHQAAGITENEEIYVLDFDNDLYDCKQLPYVVGYFDAASDENVRRVFGVVEKKLQENIRKLPGRAFNEPQDRLPHILFVLDGIHSFYTDDKYAGYHERLLRIARDGMSKGVTVVISATEPVGKIGRLLSSFPYIIAFDLPKDRYYELYFQRVDKPVSLKGRGVVNMKDDKDGVYEFQAFFPYDTESYCSLSNAVSNLIDEMKKMGVTNKSTEVLTKCESRKLKPFEGELQSIKWKTYTGNSWEEYRETKSPGLCTLGLDYENAKPVELDLLRARMIAIYGRRDFGKSDLLALMINEAAKIPNVKFVLWDDGRSALSAGATGKALERHSNLDIVKCGTKGEFLEELKSRGVALHSIPEEISPETQAHIGINSMLAELSEETNRNGIEIKSGKNVVHEDRFTVFIIQNRQIYQRDTHYDYDSFLVRLLNSIGDTEGRMLFIFSDVQVIAEGAVNVAFNASVKHVFLLDDIERFSRSKGQRTVFALLDPVELRESFGKCEKGDGFYLDIEAADLPVKMKFLTEEVIGGECVE